MSQIASLLIHLGPHSPDLLSLLVGLLVGIFTALGWRGFAQSLRHGRPGDGIRRRPPP